MKKLILGLFLLTNLLQSCGGGEEAKIRKMAQLSCQKDKLRDQIRQEQDSEKQKPLNEQLKKLEEESEDLAKNHFKKRMSDKDFLDKFQKIMKEEREKCK